MPVLPSPKTPVVTVGVPVYNGERYLPACLDSLLAQTFTDFTIIISDNASTDRTSEIAADYCRRDARVRYYRNPTNIGCPRNFGRVFDLASTPYFRWASADDQSAPEFLERCIEVLDRQPDVVQAYPRTLLIDGDGHVLRRYEDKMHAVGERPSDRYIGVTESIAFCNALYGVMRADVLRRTAMLGNYLGSDIPLQAELTLYGKIWEVPDYLLLRRMHQQASSAMSHEERAKHYDPSLAPWTTYSYWRHLWERSRAVYRAPIGRSEKARLMRFLARTSIMNRNRFATELWTNARRLLRA